jgi:hypothetical protein
MLRIIKEKAAGFTAAFSLIKKLYKHLPPFRLCKGISLICIFIYLCLTHRR